MSRHRRPRSLQELLRGFALLPDVTAPEEGGIGLLGQLLNILIDLDLPEEGECVDRCLESRLVVCAYADIQRDENNRLDRVARLALRQGKVRTAYVFFRSKRQRSLEGGEDGRRELSGLLYTTAWGPEKEALGFAEEVKRELESGKAPQGPGNEDLNYQLRSLALWTWRTRDQNAFDLLRGYSELLAEGLHTHDPGPFDFACGFLHLYCRDVQADPAWLPTWQEAQAALNRGAIGWSWRSSTAC